MLVASKYLSSTVRRVFALVVVLLSLLWCTLLLIPPCSLTRHPQHNLFSTSGQDGLPIDSQSRALQIRILQSAAESF